MYYSTCKTLTQKPKNAKGSYITLEHVLNLSVCMPNTEHSLSAGRKIALTLDTSTRTHNISYLFQCNRVSTYLLNTKKINRLHIRQSLSVKAPLSLAVKKRKIPFQTEIL